MKMKWLAASAALVTLAGCQTTGMEDSIFVRTDGRRGTDNPALARQFEIDKTVCIGETQKAAVGIPPVYYSGLGGAISASMIQDQNSRALVDILKGCMAQKGYVLVPKSQAAAVSASYKRKR